MTCFISFKRALLAVNLAIPCIVFGAFSVQAASDAATLENATRGCIEGEAPASGAKLTLPEILAACQTAMDMSDAQTHGLYLFSRAEALLEHGTTAAHRAVAKKDLTELIARGHSLAWAHERRATLALQSKELGPQLIDDLTKAIALREQPSKHGLKRQPPWRLYVLRAGALLEMEHRDGGSDFSAAHADLDRALDLKPGQKTALRLKQWILSQENATGRVQRKTTEKG